MSECKCEHMNGDPENSCCAHSMKLLCCCRESTPSPAELVALCKAYLTAKGWTERDDLAGYWYDPESTFRFYRFFTDAINEQFRRDGAL